MKETNKKGRKDDSGKPKWHLLPWTSIEQIVKVFTFGSMKYAEWNHTTVDNWKDRYSSALMRHLTAYWNGEINDSESKLSHLAHAGCCLLILMHREEKGDK